MSRHVVKTAADSSQLKAVLAHDWHDDAGHPVQCAESAMSEANAVFALLLQQLWTVT